ncbi:NAD(P)H-dependent oxidoreductase [Thalassotalea marina]|uniref:NAD(P)H-dependent oxidoreductase n=1 Tax=Thalassotalea marina TaxID=1673741 RepID=A0A919ELX4_9GAMM|nr:NAD(P)H-dependent oxidoreductase [Thalassotalea marina]GHF96215.1 NAD(P)H-dependent oxidoreductase [Thalassotalea marina]
MNILNALNWRYAVKQFSNETIAQTEVDELLEAIRLTPSAFGLQPFKTLVITNKAIQQSLVDKAYGQDKVLHCSHLLVLASFNGEPNTLVNQYFEQVCQTQLISRESISGYENHIKDYFSGLEHHEFVHWSKQQTHIALGNLLTVCALKSIDACPMTGFDHQAFDDILGLADLSLTSTVIIPIGKRSEQDENAHKAKVRYAKQDVVLEYA